MLTFLRKIRKSLIDSLPASEGAAKQAGGGARKPASPARPNGLLSGRAGRYLFYAIGEIALVVIGILIALQINNWNEDRNRTKEEFSLVNKLNLSIKSNTDLMRNSRDFDEKCIHAIRRLIYALESDEPYTDSIGYYFHLSFQGVWPTFSTSALESIRAKGIDIIGSDSIRTMVLDLFDVTYESIAEQYRVDHDSFMNNEASVYMKNFRVKEGTHAIPKDYAALLNDFEILSTLEWRLEIRQWAMEVKTNGINESNELITMIEEYLAANFN